MSSLINLIILYIYKLSILYLWDFDTVFLVRLNQNFQLNKKTTNEKYMYYQ